MKNNKNVINKKDIQIFGRKAMYSLLLNNTKDFLYINNNYELNNCLKVSMEYISILDKMINVYRDSNNINIDNYNKEIKNYISRKINKPEKIVSIINGIYNKNKEDIYSYYVKMIRALLDYYQSPITKSILTNKNINKNVLFTKKYNKKVFLSHAYDDRILALALFIEFYKNNIYLYVDWMHNGIINNGIHLKDTLERELLESDNLVLLRTPNSEINGNGNLRQWCAWEIGCFRGNHSNKCKSYLIDTLDYERNKLNNIYDDFNRITSINNIS